MRSLALSLLAVLITEVGWAQPSRDGLPRVGSELPKVSLFNERGEPVSTEAFRGSYTVLVFGCLT